MKQTQGRRLIELLKRRTYTSMRLQMLGISTCWHKRVAESLRGKERLLKFQRSSDGLNVYFVVGSDD